MATAAEEKAPLTTSLGDNPALKKAQVQAKLSSGPPRPRQQQQQPQQQRKERRMQHGGWTQQVHQPQQVQQPPMSESVADLQEQLIRAQLGLQLQQVNTQLNPPEPEGMWQKFLYGIGMLFAAKAVDRILQPAPVWKKHPGKFVAVGVLAAAFVAFLGYKATRPLE